jgi:hypothetical protein
MCGTYQFFEVLSPLKLSSEISSLQVNLNNDLIRGRSRTAGFSGKNPQGLGFCLIS